MDDEGARRAAGAERVLRQYGDGLYRLCLGMLGDPADAEDAVQDTVLKYLRAAPAFDGPGHEKAWLIAVAKNKCRDALRYRSRHPLADMPEAGPAPVTQGGSGILDALMAVPERFRLVLILYYVEEYPVKDIARIIRRTPSAVKMRLQKGRRLLEEIYRKEYM